MFLYINDRLVGPVKNEKDAISRLFEYEEMLDMMDWPLDDNGCRVWPNNPFQYLNPEMAAPMEITYCLCDEEGLEMDELRETANGFFI